MVGTNTARQDNPKLTNRLYFGKNPLRIVLDRRDDLPEDLHLFSDGLPTWQITEKITRTFSEKNVVQIEIPFDDFLLKNLLKKLLNTLYLRSFSFFSVYLSFRYHTLI